MTAEPRIYVDLMKTDTRRRVLLSTIGTRMDLERLGIALEEGLLLKLYTDDSDDDGRADNILLDGIAHFDQEARRWVAMIDWSAIRHESDR